MGGSGEINVGPNPIQQLMDNLWGPSFNPKTQPEPKCKDRSIRYGGPGVLHEMFAFCCKGPAQYTSNTLASGNEAQRRLSVRQRRKDCALCTYISVLLLPWSVKNPCNIVENNNFFMQGSQSEKCNPDTIECCYCRREVSCLHYLFQSNSWLRAPEADSPTPTTYAAALETDLRSREESRFIAKNTIQRMESRAPMATPTRL